MMEYLESNKDIKTGRLTRRHPVTGEQLDMAQTRERSFTNPSTLIDILDTVQNLGWHDSNTDYFIDHGERNQTNLIFITLSGGGILELGGVSYKLTPNTMTIIPNNVDTAYYTDPQEEHWEFYWMHLRGVNVSNILRRMYQNHVYLIPLESPERYTQIFEDILNTPLTGSKMTLFNSRCLSELLHLFVEESIIRNIIVSDNNDFVKTIIQYIEQHYMQTINLRELAGRVFMSVEYMIRTFKKYTGYTPHAYLKMYRMMRACDLLSNTELSVKEIAGRVGYKSDSNFISEFRSIKNITPNQFRKNAKHK